MRIKNSASDVKCKSSTTVYSETLKKLRGNLCLPSISVCSSGRSTSHHTAGLRCTTSHHRLQGSCACYASPISFCLFFVYITVPIQFHCKSYFTSILVTITVVLTFLQEKAVTSSTVRASSYILFFTNNKTQEYLNVILFL
jgi:hypothetical protein